MPLKKYKIETYLVHFYFLLEEQASKEDFGFTFFT